MPPTGMIESWSQSPLEIGPIYPFVGFEGMMVAACVLFGIAFTIWKFRSESTHYVDSVRQLELTGEPARLLKTAAHRTKSGEQGDT